MTGPSALRRESRDVDGRALGLFAAGLTGFIALALVALRLMFGPASAPRPFGAGTDLFGSGRVTLQTDPAADASAYEAEQRRLLTSYGWVDRNAGIARIPVAAAMAIVASRGIADWGTKPPQDQTACSTLIEVPRTPRAAPCLAGSGGPVP
jgi:hypothetical protein